MMMRNLSAVAVALCCSTALAAQEPRLDKPSSTIIVAGCLQHADPTAVNLGDPKPAFILTDAVPVARSPAADAASATSGAVGTTGASPATYALEGSDAELAMHAARQVEVTGSVVMPLAADHLALPRAQPEAERLHVASVKEVAMDCAPKS